MGLLPICRKRFSGLKHAAIKLPIFLFANGAAFIEDRRRGAKRANGFRVDLDVLGLAAKFVRYFPKKTAVNWAQPESIRRDRISILKYNYYWNMAQASWFCIQRVVRYRSLDVSKQ